MEQRFLLELEGRLAGRLFQAEGGLAKVQESGDGAMRVRHVSPVELDPLRIEFGTGMSRAFYEWVGGALQSRIYTRKSGAVIALDTGSKPTARREFLDALITGIVLPDLDATSKKDAVIKVVMQPERARVQAESKVNLGVYTSSLANAWTVNNFRFRIDGLHNDCAQVKRIQGLQMKQGIKKMYTGEDRFPTIEPTKVEFRRIAVEVPVGYGKEFQQWHTATQDRKMSYGLEKNGAIEFLAPGGKSPYFVLNLSGIEIVSMEKLAHAVSVELIFKGMSLKPGGAAIK